MSCEGALGWERSSPAGGGWVSSEGSVTEVALMSVFRQGRRVNRGTHTGVCGWVGLACGQGQRDMSGRGQLTDAPVPVSVFLTCASGASVQEAVWADTSWESGAAARVPGARALQAVLLEVGPTSSGGKAGLALRHLLELPLSWQLTAIACKPGLREGVLGVLLRVQRMEHTGGSLTSPTWGLHPRPAVDWGLPGEL